MPRSVRTSTTSFAATPRTLDARRPSAMPRLSQDGFDDLVHDPAQGPPARIAAMTMWLTPASIISSRTSRVAAGASGSSHRKLVCLPPDPEDLLVADTHLAGLDASGAAGTRSGGREDADPAVAGQAAARRSDVGARRWRDVSVVTAGRDRDVAAGGPAAVTRVEGRRDRGLSPWNDHLDPRVRAALAEQMAGHVPGRQPDHVAQRDHHVREILG